MRYTIGWWFALALTLSIFPFLSLAEGDYKLPYTGGKTYPVSQGNSADTNGDQKPDPDGTHGCFDVHRKSGRCLKLEQYAFDFAMPEGSDVVATAAGTVSSFVKEDSTQGGCLQKLANDANYIVIDHPDGTRTLYLHIQYNSVAVNPLTGMKLKLGDTVLQGQQIAKSGNTGFSCGPHLHFQRQEQGKSWYTQSVGVAFSDVLKNQGIPIATYSYTSGNYVVIPTGDKVLGSVQIAHDHDIYPTPVSLTNRGAFEVICPEVRVTEKKISPVGTVKAGEVIEIIDITDCIDYFGPYVQVRTRSGILGYTQSNSDWDWGSIRVFNDEGAFKILSLGKTKCEGEPDCIRESYAEPYEQFIKSYPTSKYIPEAALEVSERYAYIAKTFNRLASDPKTPLFDGSQEKYTKHGRQYLLDQSKQYQKLSSEFSEIAKRGIHEIPFPAEWKMFDVYLNKTIEIPIFKNAYKRVVQQIPEKLWKENKSWLTLLPIVAFPNRFLSTPYGKFIYMHGCQPHSCPDNWIKIIYDPTHDRIAVLLYDHDYGELVVGDNASETRTLLKTLKD